MNWKHYKTRVENGETNEDVFVLGIDIGAAGSTIAYFDTQNKKPSLIDLSGGYGKPSMPSIIQFVTDTREWVFGEYALLNKGLFNDCTFSSVIDKMGKNEYVEIGKKTVSACSLLAKYIKELVDCCKNINPQAEIAGIVVTAPTYFSDEAKEELSSAFRIAGYSKELIDIISARQGCLSYNEFIGGNNADNGELIAIIDYGANKLRGSVLRTKVDSDMVLTSIVSYYEKAGFNETERKILNFFTDVYCNERHMERERLTEKELNQIEVFAYQNKSQIFKTNKTGKQPKLYYNFAYPPFAKEIEQSVIAGFMDELERNITDFAGKLIDGTRQNVITCSMIDKVIILGGGFEIPFVKQTLSGLFPYSEIVCTKFAKSLLAEGAAVYAAKRLGVYDGAEFVIKDDTRLGADIGFEIKSGDGTKFFPIAQKNSFWFDKRESEVFTLLNAVDDKSVLTLLERGKFGEEKPVCEISLANMPKRPKGTTRLKVCADFVSHNEFSVMVEDFGFGEMFPKSDFRAERAVILTNVK